MGNKFCSINVQGGEAAQIQSIAKEYVVREITNGWITVVSENDVGSEWYITREVARQLSKAMPGAVLFVEYFDDDYVDFSLYKDGEKKDCHIPVSYDEASQKQGNVKTFSKILSLSPEDEKLLKLIFSEEDPGTSVSLIESLLGCPIFADAETLKDVNMKNDGTYTDRKYLNEYAAKKKKESQIKNQIKLVLRGEKEGGLAGRTGGGTPVCLPIVYRVENPLYKGSRLVEFFDIDSNGIPQKLFDAKIAEGVGMSSWVSRAHGITILACDNADYIVQPDGINVKITRTIHVFSDNGELLDKLDAAPFLKGLNNNSKPFILDDSRFFCNGKCYNFRQRRIEWSCGPEIGNVSWTTPVLLPDGNLLCRYDINNDCMFCILETSGKELIQITISPSRPHWRQPIIFRDRLINIYETDRQKPWSDHMICYDLALNELWRHDLPESSAFGDPVIDEDSGILYFQRTPHDTMAFDIESQEIIAESNESQGKYRTVEAFAPGIGLVCKRDGASSIDVLDKDLNLVSSHKTRGNIGFFTRQDNRLFLVSYSPEKHNMFGIVSNPGHTYVYELTP